MAKPTSPAYQTWPMLRSIMDQALMAPQGLRLSSLGGRPLTVASASALRNSMGKVRMASRLSAQKALPSDSPAWGISPYDALTMVVTPLLEKATIQIDYFHSPIPEEWLTTPLERLPVEARTPATACTITIHTPLGGILQVKNAPSFSEGWRGIRNELPAALDIINTYQAQEGKDFTLLGTPPANQPEPPSPRTTPFGLKTVR